MLSPELPESEPAPYIDRRGGLVAFGIVTMLLGGVCALFVPLMIAATSMAPKAGPAVDSRAILPAVFLYGGLAVTFFWLGLGSIKARRWARALLLILSWSWLLVGVFTMVTMAFVMPKMSETMNVGVTAGPSAPPMDAIMGFAMFIVFIIMVLIPGVWVLFYRSRHVKATCEAEDPGESWTDRCPLPVIAISIWLLSVIPSLLFMVLGYKSVVPLFGTFVVGPIAVAVYLLFGAVWVYAAWAIYKLRWSGWWAVVVSVVLFTISAFLTYSRHDITELYELMGYPAEQVAMMKKFSFMSGPTAGWASVGFALPFLGYLMFLRKYFVAANVKSD